ncbi:MAG: ATP-binding protein [Syntrophales bacterium]|nr:ATP-binding protein [Syntrophales bacterium]
MADEGKNSYLGLRRYIVIILCAAAAIPLGLIGGTIYYQYRNSISERVTTQLTSIVREHKEAIEKFLQEVTSAMRVVTQLKTLNDLRNRDVLQKVFDSLQREYDHAFEDLGVIDAQGNHLAYIGPYDLLGKNYRGAAWFKETMEKEVFISDVFLGFRQVPHFIAAVKKGKGREAWILRATINAARFSSLVENVRLGRTGEAFIVSSEGFYQTQSRIGNRIMERAPPGSFDLTDFAGVKFWEVMGKNGRKVLRAKTWMKNGHWLLIVQQDDDDAFSELYATRNRAIAVFIFGALVIGMVTFLTTRLLVRKIERIDREKNILDEQLIQSSKLASIGELSAGIAHEINNPLAIIGEEAGWMQDLLRRPGLKELEGIGEFRDSLREICQQAGRCREITHKLLSFARKMESVVKDVELNRLIEEVVSMREREASLNNIKFVKNYQKDLPLIYSDPSLLRQVFLNLINNAIDALQKGGEIKIETVLDGENPVEVKIGDTGVGIPRENLKKIFDPFFTTKAPGKGTGLGLSICHGIMEKLGGRISVTSQVGEGTVFTVYLPREH